MEHVVSPKMDKISLSGSERTTKLRDILDLKRNGSRIEAQENTVTGIYFRLKSWTSTFEHLKGPLISHILEKKKFCF